MIILDVECYSNYFLLSLLNSDTGATKDFELYEGKELECKKIADVLRTFKTLGFNSSNYDLPMIVAALRGDTNQQLKQLSDAIINSEQVWPVLRQFKINVPSAWQHIDIIALPIGQASLKIYGGRLHAPKLQDLPIEPNALISAPQRALLREYCHNDLNTTKILYDALKPQIALREQMSEQYNIDLLSKSDAQIAECIIKHELEAQDIECTRPKTIKRGTTYHYQCPKHITFKDKKLKELVKLIEFVDFVVGDNGQFTLPPELLKKNNLQRSRVSIRDRWDSFVRKRTSCYC